MDKLNVVSFKIAKVCPLSTFNSKFLFTCNLYLNRPNNYITKLKNFSHSLKAGINSGWNHVRCCLLYVITFEKTSLNVSKRRLKRLLLRRETFWIVVGIFNGREYVWWPYLEHRKIILNYLRRSFFWLCEMFFPFFVFKFKLRMYKTW